MPEYVEAELHKFLRPRGLWIKIVADTGVTPSEPDQYWSVWVTDSQHANPGLGRCVTGGTNGNTSPESLLNLIEETVERWKDKFGG